MILLFSVAIVAFLLYVAWHNTHILNKDLLWNFSSSDVPQIKVGFYFSKMEQGEIFNFIRQIALKFKKSVRCFLFNHEILLVFRGKDAGRILRNSTQHLTKGLFYNVLHPFMGTGLVTSDGEKWRTRRKILTPAFHFNVLDEYCETFKEEGDQLVEKLRGFNGNVVDIAPIFTQLVLNILCESAMGVKLSSLGKDGESYHRNVREIGKACAHRVARPWLYSKLIYSLLGYNKKLEKFLKPTYKFSQTIIDKRRNEFALKSAESDRSVFMKERKKRAAMMDTMLQAQSDGLIDDHGIIEETDTILFGSPDTTSTAMIFTLLLLAHHPDAQEKLYVEVQNMECKSDNLSINDLKKLNYMDRVIKESLRLYPPIPMITRILTEDFPHEGEIIPKGADANIFIYDIHRDPNQFSDPERFNPDRFLPENSKDRNKFAFIPFSAGPRNCIGQRFAMLELMVMLTKIIKNFKIHPVTKREDLTFVADIVLRTKQPVEMIFEQR